MNQWRITITLPDAPAAHAQHSVNIGAGKLHVAVSRAMAGVMSNQHIKGRRIQSAIIHAYKIEKEK